MDIRLYNIPKEYAAKALQMALQFDGERPGVYGSGEGRYFTLGKTHWARFFVHRSSSDQIFVRYYP